MQCCTAASHGIPIFVVVSTSPLPIIGSHECSLHQPPWLYLLCPWGHPLPSLTGSSVMGVEIYHRLREHSCWHHWLNHCMHIVTVHNKYNKELRLGAFCRTLIGRGELCCTPKILGITQLACSCAALSCLYRSTQSQSNHPHCQQYNQSEAAIWLEWTSGGFDIPCRHVFYHCVGCAEVTEPERTCRSGNMSGDCDIKKDVDDASKV